MNITAVIIDDERAGRESLRLDLKKFCPGVQILGMADSGRAGINLINQASPELVFLDIEMPEMDGFEMLMACRTLDFALVFVTAHQHYAVEALRQNAVDFLCKPVAPDELLQAVDRAIARQAERSLQQRLQATVAALRKQTLQDTLLIPTSGKHLRISTQDILYARSDGNYCRFFMEDGQEYFINWMLKKALDRLSESGFLRIHRQYIVNLRKVHSYLPGDGGNVILLDGSKLPVSRTCKDELLAALDS
ncbi:MAG TPA: LytTR family DNA-binding domain-containing protein [Phaeodactylibacter sp.]|nr:LytTR family DNA-binding domain-containing protein [Phaeodactylibacter sp.]